MYLRIGNTFICNSETDGVTKTLSAPTPTLSKASDSVQPKGSTNPTHFQRKGVSRTLEITIGREFKSYREAEVWVVEHMAEMETFRDNGDLEFSSMFDVGYLYGTATLEQVEVVDAIGVHVQIKYTFKAGRAITYFPVSIVEDDVEYVIVMADGTGEFMPTVRTSKGA